MSGAVFIIAAYNAEKFIREAVESCLNQTLSCEEIIVIDDGSTDGTKRILEQFGQAITLICNTGNKGRAASVNAVLDAAPGKYIALLDADDIAEPNRLERQVEFMESHPEVGCSSSLIRYINSKGKVIAKGSLDLLTADDMQRYRDAKEPFGLYCPAVILRSEILHDPSLRFRQQFWPADDIDLWNRIAEVGWEVLVQPEFLVRYRVHANSAVTSGFLRTEEKFQYVRRCLKARRCDQPEPSWPEFKIQMKNRPLRSRIDSWRKTHAKMAYRAAGFSASEGNYPSALLNFLKAALLHPKYPFKRAMSQLRS